MCGCSSSNSSIVTYYPKQVKINNDCNVTKEQVLISKNYFLDLQLSKDYTKYSIFEINTWLGDIETMLNLKNYCLVNLP